MANNKTQGKSQQRRGIAPPATGTDYSGSAGTPVTKTRDEWLKRLRKRPQKETTEQPTAQGYRSKKLPAATKVVKRKGGGQVEPESKSGVTSGSKGRPRQRQPAR
ncbi:hypothetical protein K469DRAFT_807454 [Zopfia rhizophila CBS 207.26]|uniref:Uncharacterized protein n=1 Tax=Zopfia rhizophila CBS 207.26 TaxID=1314779 RepID=A0A6A6DDJ5_9PEZI|nr:hypothetical protein K469DRAFT_807454 [Zopfia rhizophila CBS 207.26]